MFRFSVPNPLLDWRAGPPCPLCHRTLPPAGSRSPQPPDHEGETVKQVVVFSADQPVEPASARVRGAEPATRSPSNDLNASGQGRPALSRSPVPSSPAPF